MTRLLGFAAIAVFLAACQGRTSFLSGSGTAPARSGQTVSLSDQDLAPVDALISGKNRQWILGDHVEVDASKEYFGQNLTINTTIGLTERTDTTEAYQTVVRIRYLGAPGTASVTTSPRVLIGTGLTIMARETLVVRLFKTRDASRPVVLHVRAHGDAARGRGEETQQRAPQLVLGGELRQVRGRTSWNPYR